LNLTKLFKDEFPEIKLAGEYEKDLLIERFAASGGFARTHSLISELSSYSDFSKEQANEIVLHVLATDKYIGLAKIKM
jgi:hypothetical protein